MNTQAPRTRIWVGTKRDLVRFGLFVVVVAGLVWYVTANLPRFLTADAPAPPPPEPVLSQNAVPAPPVAPAAGQVQAVAPTPTSIKDFFSQARYERDHARNALMERIKEAMAQVGSDPVNSKEYVALSRMESLEKNSEMLVRGLGYDDALVVLSDTGTAQMNAQVFVRSAQLDQGQVSQVADLVSRTAGVRMQNIVVRGQER